MNIYGTEQIHNAVLPGHEGAGRTTVAEAPALIMGMTTRMGKVPDDNTISDYDKEEIKKQLSISIMLIPLEYTGEDGPIKINLLDMPGFFDLVGEAEGVISIADTAITVVNCKVGIGPGTEKVWEVYERYDLPRLISVTNMDDNHASYRELVVKMETCFERKIVSFQLPTRESEKPVGFVNAAKAVGRRFIKLSDCEEREIPDYIQKDLTIVRDVLIEAVTGTNEEYMERYFLGGEFTQEEISTALRKYVIEGNIVSATMGSGINCQGFKVLPQAIDRYFPSPDHFECIGVSVSAGERPAAKYNDDASLPAGVFKTTMDPFIGKYSLMKVHTDTLKGGAMVRNVNKDVEEKIGKFYILRDRGQIGVQELRTDDIGTVAGLIVTQTGDTMAARMAPIVYRKPQTSTPYTYMAYKAANKGGDDKISTVLARMMEENLTLKVVNGAENRQSLLYGIGDQQLDVVVSELQGRYRMDIILSGPRLAFREALHEKVKVQGKHKKQPSGHGQYGNVIIESEPSGDLETPFVFEEKVFDSSVPGDYFLAVGKGFQECAVRGPPAGYPVAGLRATLLDGPYHPVDFFEIAFKMATILAFKQGSMDANPVLPEPIASLKVTVLDKFTGDATGDLNRRRGHILGMNPDHNGEQVIEVDIPMSELSGYNTGLRSMMGGIDLYSYGFTRCEQAPDGVQKREVETRVAAKNSKRSA